MSRPLVAGNWKMHGSRERARALGRAILDRASRAAHVDLLVCPTSLHLSLLGEVLDGSAVRLGAQNGHDASEGAFTGEVSVSMLAELGCTYVILGHSERRQLFLESDELVRRKFVSALAAGLRPIVCIGETEAEREDGLTLAVLERQLKGGIDTGAAAGAGFDVAYEPVWAIGTGRTATPEMVADAHRSIREVLAALVGPGAAGAVRILYGGSVKPGNAAELLATAGVDGALVGGASLDAESFLSIAEAAPR